MDTQTSPEAVVRRQLDAYNARDLDGWLETYAEDARQYEFPAKLLATGHAEIRTRTASRLQEPNIHAELLQRAVMGNIVIDHENVIRTFPEGPGRIEVTCIYEVRDGKIQAASFVFGAKSLDSAQAPTAT